MANQRADFPNDARAVLTYQGQPAGSGTNTLVAAVAGKQIYVLSYCLQATGTTTAQFQDTTPANLSPAWTFQAREGVNRPALANGALFATAPGAGLVLTLGAAVGVNVELQYIIV